MVLRLKLGCVELKVSSDDCGAPGEDGDSALELSNVLSLFVSKNWVTYEQVVVDALPHSELCSDLVVKSRNREWKGRVLSVNFTEENSCLVTLKLIPDVQLTLEDGGSECRLLGLSLSS